MFFLNMKKGAILFLIFGIFLIGISSAIPYILFVNPTPSDNYETTSDSFEINSSITNLSGLEELIFNWDGTNYTFYNNSLVLMMNFENNSGLGENDSFVRDLSKYENNGTVFGAIFNLAGRYRGAYSFSGRDKITIANSASLNITDNLTISLWAKRNNVVVKQVSVGKLYSCVLTEKGDVYCWGENIFGQLGTGNFVNSLSPKLVLGGHNFSSISAGFCHICAINTTGSAYCWGYNTFGQLGNGNVTTMYTPQNVLREYNFTSIDGGYPHTCATTTIGTTYCWGSNACGQTGIGRASVLFPSYKAIKSVLIGKSVDSFLIGETFGGTIVSILNQNPVEFGTPSGWVNILLSYNQTADLYLNGTLVNNSAYIQIDSDPSVITIGENFDGTIDEIRILNRTVLASEVQQFYKSNLKKINETSWEFYSNQSLDSEKTYSYFLFAKDSVSSYRLLRNIIKFPFSEEDLFSDSSSGIFKPTQKQLKEGYVKILTKKQKVQVNLSNGEQYLAEIKEVNKILEKVVVSIGGNNYSIAKNSSEKIDLNNDGYYDLQVSVTQIYITGYAKVEFKEIHEEISQENKESVTESAVDNNEDAVSNKNKLIYYVLGFVVLILIISLIILKSLKKNL